jgi:hypothetical protein
MIGKHRWLFDSSLNLCRKAAGLPGNNWGWHSTQIFWTPVFFRNRSKDGSIKAGADILISLTWPDGSADRKEKPSPSALIAEKSKMARLPVL